jgi:hypothetical protein
LRLEKLREVNPILAKAWAGGFPPSDSENVWHAAVEMLMAGNFEEREIGLALQERWPGQAREIWNPTLEKARRHVEEIRRRNPTPHALASGGVGVMSYGARSHRAWAHKALGPSAGYVLDAICSASAAKHGWDGKGWSPGIFFHRSSQDRVKGDKTWNRALRRLEHVGLARVWREGFTRMISVRCPSPEELDSALAAWTKTSCKSNKVPGVRP